MERVAHSFIHLYIRTKCRLVSEAFDVGRPLAMAEETCSGRVVSAQANFVRVQILSRGAEDQKVLERTSLLCTVRQLLKKTQQTIMVGDFVIVSGIDWVEVLAVFVSYCRMS